MEIIRSTFWATKEKSELIQKYKRLRSVGGPHHCRWWPPGSTPGAPLVGGVLLRGLCCPFFHRILIFLARPAPGPAALAFTILRYGSYARLCPCRVRIIASGTKRGVIRKGTGHNTTFRPMECAEAGRWGAEG